MRHDLFVYYTLTVVSSLTPLWEPPRCRASIRWSSVTVDPSYVNNLLRLCLAIVITSA